MRVPRWGLATLAVVVATLSQHPAPAGVETTRRHVEFLASSDLEGRLTGSEGERRAADYIVEQLESIGFLALPGRDGFRLPFEYTAGSRDAGSSVQLELGQRAKRWEGTRTVQALSFSDTGSVSGPVVFAGYGLAVPEGRELSYDSYAGLDVEGKIVLVLRYFPEDAAEEVRTGLARYSGLRYKAVVARDHGAKALLVVTGPRSPNAGNTVDLGFDAALSGSGILAASISDKVAAKMLERGGKRGLEEVQRALDTANPHVTGFELPGVQVRLEVKLERERRTGHNVVGYLPASAPAAEPQDYLMLGAHFDHLGRGRHGNSMAKKEEAGRIHHGADDNASGVAAVLGAGARLAQGERRQPILLCFWSGEELGLLGSSAFVRDGIVPAQHIAAYVNLDMVGRMRDNRLTVQGVGSSSAWPALIERVNAVVGFDVQTQEDPYLPTDSITFYQARVPTLSLFTGAHEDYHRPTDRADLLNYADLERVTEFTTLLARKLDGLEHAPAYVEVQARPATSGDRDTVRAYTGTIPDYTTEVEGLRLSGVIGGGPADRAGLREGDVIVELGGRRIANIYDYTYALDVVKVDQPVRVVFRRGSERREVQITPTARP